MRVEQFLKDAARLWPARTALVSGETRLSFEALDGMSDRLAAGFARLGLRRHDRAVVMMDNGWEAAVSLFAVLKAGGTAVPVNPSVKAERLGFILRNCEPRLVVSQVKLAPVVFQAANASAIEPAIVIAGAQSEGPGFVSLDACLAEEDIPLGTGGVGMDLAFLIYTSGSTGEPKGVMLSHGSAEAACTAIAAYLGTGGEDVVGSVLPFSFGYGLFQLLMSVRAGGRLVVERSFAFPVAVLDVFRAEKVSVFPLVPTIAAMVLRMDEGVSALPGLRVITTAAAAMPPERFAALQARFPQARIFSMYGQTECLRSAYLPPEELGARPGSVGVAIPGTELLVLDEDGAEAAPGATGELAVRSPHLMEGYWGDAEASARALEPLPARPWERVLRTGDLFRRDGDGFFYFVARKDDVIKSRGEKVPPAAVEAVLLACPGVSEALVFGLDDPVLGQSVQAVVVRADPDLEERAVLRFCAARLEDFMVPKAVRFAATLPSTDTGKASRRVAADEMRISA